jgi:hypothetical protein
VKAIAARDMGLSESELDERLGDLVVIIPEMRTKVPSMKPDLLAKLAADTRGVARRLVRLKELFPLGNVSLMATNRPDLVLDDALLDRLGARAEALREALPGFDVDKMVEQQPALLDIEDPRGTVEHVQQMFGGSLGGGSVLPLIKNDPNLLFMAQRGSGLVPYDDPLPSGHGDPEDEGYFKV